MELSFSRSQECRSRARRSRRSNRAQWWFARMREAVDQALDRAPLPRPEQMVFANAHREALGSVQERQVCE